MCDIELAKNIPLDSPTLLPAAIASVGPFRSENGSTSNLMERDKRASRRATMKWTALFFGGFQIGSAESLFASGDMATVHRRRVLRSRVVMIEIFISHSFRIPAHSTASIPPST